MVQNSAAAFNARDLNLHNSKVRKWEIELQSCVCSPLLLEIIFSIKQFHSRFLYVTKKRKGYFGAYSWSSKRWITLVIQNKIYFSAVSIFQVDFYSKQVPFYTSDKKNHFGSCTKYYKNL